MCCLVRDLLDLLGLVLGQFEGFLNIGAVERHCVLYLELELIQAVALGGRQVILERGLGLAAYRVASEGGFLGSHALLAFSQLQHRLLELLDGFLADCFLLLLLRVGDLQLGSDLVDGEKLVLVDQVRKLSDSGEELGD